MTNQQLLKRLQELETAERDVASSMDMPQENTANWTYAETAALARSAILQQQVELKQLRDEVTALRLEFACERQEVERLRLCLQGVAGCGTCEACRGAAQLTLSGHPGGNPHG